MKKIRYAFTLVAAALSFAAAQGAHAQWRDVPSTSRTMEDLRDHWIVVEQEIPGHFYDARQALVLGDYRQAAQEIRSAESLMRIVASQTGAETQPRIKQAADDLSQLADTIDKGSLKTVHPFDAIFAEAHEALAWNDYVSAKNEWTQDDPYGTGLHLDAALDNLQSAVAWSGYDWTASESTELDNAKILSGQMIAGTKYNRDAVIKALNFVENKIDEITKTPVPGG